MSTMTISANSFAAQTRPVAPRGAGQVRLTRRGRLVIFAFALLLVLGLGVLWAAGSVATEDAGQPEPTRVVMVGSGQTLWGIAAEIADDGQTRAMVAKIEQLNALDTAMVDAGQRIRIPVNH